MKNKSLFAQIISIVILAVVCLMATVGISLLAGTVDADIFDLRKLNFSNVILVLFIGGFISCVAVGIGILFVTRTAWIKTKDYFKENNKKGETKK